jgi:hypothetical protein
MYYANIHIYTVFFVDIVVVDQASLNMVQYV